MSEETIASKTPVVEREIKKTPVDGIDQLLGIDQGAVGEMTPFVKNLTGSPAVTRKQRATALMLRVREAQENMIREIVSKINVLNNDLLTTFDLRGSSSIDLNIRNIDVVEFTKKIQEIKMELYAEKIALAQARETYRQLFGKDYS